MLLLAWIGAAIAMCHAALDVPSGVSLYMDGIDLSPLHEVEDIKSKNVMFISLAIRGHATPLLRIAEEMVQRGYNVSFATHDSGKEWVQRTGAHFVSAGAFPISADALRIKLQSITRDASTFRGILNMFNEIYVPAAQPMYDALYPVVSNNKPDLVIIDIATIGGHDLVHKLNLPYLVNSPSILFDMGGTPSYVPAWGTGFSIYMTLWNRCMNLLFPRLLSVALTPPFMQVNKARWELQLAPYRSQHDIFKGSRIMVNTAFGLEYARPLSPLVDMVGPILPLESLDATTATKALPPLISQWMESESAGVIYISFGTLSYIDPWQAAAIVDGLAMLHQAKVSHRKQKTDAISAPFHVLWTLPNDQRHVLPPNLPQAFRIKVLGSGFPHLKVLAQPSVKLVISHCGMVSAQEALMFGKPILCLPFLVDQPDVAARVIDAGAGLMLDKTYFTAEEVRSKAMELITNVSYTRSAKRVGSALKDAGGIDRVLEIVEGTLRFGNNHLKTVDLYLPWHKVVMLDVWAVYAAIVCLGLVGIRVFWLFCYRFLRGILVSMKKQPIQAIGEPPSTAQ
ncbi:hypothetical protein THRCLA_09340 [Thraustotheca clavata]|uniref:Uncharacterized protein n=1 Tax=Thraustotheca clavata TaxID=74557 RepID=A0A1V9YXK0_9STRA|nr:hypothetical protein THRCLA_09340 [Thraustotheca clavata]